MSRFPLILVSCLVVVLLAVSLGATANAIEEEIGPVSIKIVSNGDPVNVRHEDGGTPSNPGDDDVDLAQRVDLVQIKAKAAGLPDTEWKMDPYNTWVNHPVWALADRAFADTYQTHAPTYVRETFDVDFREYSFKITLNIQTPVYQDNRCDGKCEFPYGIYGKYDSMRLPPVGFIVHNTDFFIGFTANVSRDCRPDPPIVTTVCPPHVLPEQGLYDLTPNASAGFYMAEVEAKTQPGPDQASGQSADLDDERKASLFQDESQASPIGLWPVVVEHSMPTLPATSGLQASERRVTAQGENAADGIAPGAGASTPPWLETVLLIVALLILPFFAAYNRLKPDRVLYHPLRRRLYDLVVENPGIHLGAIAAALKVPHQTADYHATQLEQAHFIASRTFGNKRCFFLNGGRFTALEQHVNALLQRENTRRILETLANEESLTQRGLAKRLGVSDSTIYWHLKRMRSLELVNAVPGRPKALSLNDTARSVVRKSLDEMRSSSRPT